MIDLAPTVDAVLTPTGGHLADILHVELSVGDRESTTYGTDTYGSWDYGGKQEWVRWDCDITSLRMVRGRQTRLERNSPGVCDFTAAQIVPAAWMTTPPTARPARIITNDGRLVFYGIIESAVLNREYGFAEWQVTIVDDLARLGRLEIATLTRPKEDIGTRIDALLAAAGLITYNRTYGPFVQAIDGSGRKVLDEMGIAIDTWRWHYLFVSVAGAAFGGAALIDRQGAFTTALAAFPPDTINLYDYPYRISPDPGAHPHNAKRWLGDALSVEFAADLADLRNYLTYANAGDTATVTQDTASVAAYGPRSYQRMDLIAASSSTVLLPASEAPLTWHQSTMQPTPKLRFKTVTVDCWNRPAGAMPLIDILANLDVSHVVEIRLPDQDDAGGDIANEPPPPTAIMTSGSFIYGIAWDLADGQALLTMTLDCGIIRTTKDDD